MIMKDNDIMEVVVHLDAIIDFLSTKTSSDIIWLNFIEMFFYKIVKIAFLLATL